DGAEAGGDGIAPAFAEPLDRFGGARLGDHIGHAEGAHGRDDQIAHERVVVDHHDRDVVPVQSQHGSPGAARAVVVPAWRSRSKERCISAAGATLWEIYEQLPTI